MKSSVEKMVSQSITSMGHVSPEYQTTNNSGTISNDHFCFCYQSSTENRPIHVLNPVVSRISIRTPQDERRISPRCTEEKKLCMGKVSKNRTVSISERQHGSLNVPIEHHPTIRYMVYNGYYKVMSNIPKMGQLPTPGQASAKYVRFLLVDMESDKGLSSK